MCFVWLYALVLYCVTFSVRSSMPQGDKIFSVITCLYFTENLAFQKSSHFLPASILLSTSTHTLCHHPSIHVKRALPWVSISNYRLDSGNIIYMITYLFIYPLITNFIVSIILFYIDWITVLPFHFLFIIGMELSIMKGFLLPSEHFSFLFFTFLLN